MAGCHTDVSPGQHVPNQHEWRCLVAFVLIDQLRDVPTTAAGTMDDELVLRDAETLTNASAVDCNYLCV